VGCIVWTPRTDRPHWSGLHNSGADWSDRRGLYCCWSYWSYWPQWPNGSNRPDWCKFYRCWPYWSYWPYRLYWRYWLDGSNWPNGSNWSFQHRCRLDDRYGWNIH
jgi:hypothetical protein